jgi:hypothetical protein
MNQITYIDGRVINIETALPGHSRKDLRTSVEGKLTDGTTRIILESHFMRGSKWQKVELA